METLFDPNDKKQIGKYTMVLIVVLAVFVGIKAINALKEYSFIGENVPAMNVISVTGKGEVSVKPDVASFTYSVVEEGKTPGEAQDKATKKNNAILDALKDGEIAEKDIKTVSYNIYPKYDYTTSVCTAYACPPGKSVISGYEISQSIELKVRNIEKAGDMLALVGGLGVSNVSGLNFVVDDMEALKAAIQAAMPAEAEFHKIEEVFTEIHRSNMSKLDENGKPIYREDGKILKSNLYFKPQIKEVLER